MLFDFRGRMPLGKDNMGGGSANVVTDPAADTVGSVNGQQTQTLLQTPRTRTRFKRTRGRPVLHN